MTGRSSHVLLALALLASLPAAAQAPPRPRKAAPPQKAQPTDPLRALVAQAEEALQKEDYAAAAAAWKKYLEQRPEDALAHFHLGFALTGLKELGAARAAYRRAIELDAKLVEAHLNLGLLLLEEDAAAAVAPLEKATELAPENKQARFLLGLALERSGRGAEAVEHYRRAVALAPDSFDPHFALARALLALGRAADAEQHFRRALELRVGFAPAQLGLAESLLAQKKPDEAARLLAAYLEQAPDDHESRVELAAVYAGLGQDGPALAELDRAAAAGFGSLRAHELRAEILVRQRKLPEAAEALENAAALASEDAALHARLGRIRLELRDFAAAERALKEALRRKPELTDALRDLGATYYLTERYDAALEVYDLVAQRETPTVYSWFVRATCYDKLGRKEEALAAYKQFVALDQGRSDKQDFQARQRIRILTRELERKKGR